MGNFHQYCNYCKQVKYIEAFNNENQINIEDKNKNSVETLVKSARNDVSTERTQSNNISSDFRYLTNENYEKSMCKKNISYDLDKKAKKDKVNKSDSDIIKEIAAFNESYYNGSKIKDDDEGKYDIYYEEEGQTEEFDEKYYKDLYKDQDNTNNSILNKMSVIVQQNNSIIEENIRRKSIQDTSMGLLGAASITDRDPNKISNNYNHSNNNYNNHKKKKVKKTNVEKEENLFFKNFSIEESNQDVYSSGTDRNELEAFDDITERSRNSPTFKDRMKNSPFLNKVSREIKDLKELRDLKDFKPDNIFNEIDCSNIDLSKKSYMKNDQDSINKSINDTKEEEKIEFNNLNNAINNINTTNKNETIITSTTNGNNNKNNPNILSKFSKHKKNTKERKINTTKSNTLKSVKENKVLHDLSATEHNTEPATEPADNPTSSALSSRAPSGRESDSALNEAKTNSSSNNLNKNLKNNLNNPLAKSVKNFVLEDKFKEKLKSKINMSASKPIIGKTSKNSLSTKVLTPRYIIGSGNTIKKLE